jgi:hypothetical protein
VTANGEPLLILNVASPPTEIGSTCNVCALEETVAAKASRKASREYCIGRLNEGEAQIMRVYHYTQKPYKKGFLTKT